MGVIVRIECQKCEAIHEVELGCVVLLGYKDDKVALWYHDIDKNEMLDLIGQALQYLALEKDT